MVQLRRFFKVVNGGTPSSDPENWDGDVVWVTPEDLGKAEGGRIATSRRTLTERGLATGATLVPPGSLVLSTRAPIGHVAIADRELAFNQGCRGLVPIGDSNPRFYYYVLLALRAQLQALGQGTTFMELSTGALASFRVPAPPRLEQDRVVEALDQETALLDGMVSGKRQLLGLLAERRKRALYDAASGRLGAAGSAPRRESHLPWLDSVPAHWSTAKLTRVARLGSGHTPSRSMPEYWVDCHIPWITTGEVAQVRDDRREVLYDTREHISDLGVANSAAVVHPAGTVVLSRTASAGYSAIMGKDMATSQDFVTWTCSDQLIPRFLLLCLRAMRPDLLGRLAMGSTHKTIYVPDIESIRIPLPPVEEQEQAVAACAELTATIDELSQHIERQLPLLLERRDAIVYSGVTGYVSDAAEFTAA